MIKRFRRFRSTAYQRGYEEAMKVRPEHDARQKAWEHFLMSYYYKHQNHHLKKEVQGDAEPPQESQNPTGAEPAAKEIVKGYGQQD